MKADLKVPEVVQNLYRDLRDRRLLPVVVLLVAAIIAVPFLLKGGDSEAQPLAAAPVDAVAGAPEARPVVIGADPELRDFHERLDGLRSRNPFKQQLLPETDELTTDARSRSGTGLETQETATSSSTGTSTDTASSTAPTDGSGSTDTTGGSSDSSGSESEGETRVQVLRPMIDVKTGRLHKAKVKKGIAPLTLLPSSGHPVVQYTGSNINAKGASFVVSRDVVSTSGDGVCKPKPADCRFLHLKIGQRKRLTLSDGKVYVLKLLAVHIERVKPNSGK